jgi:DNA-binding SARP family transcriptional activator
MQMGILKISLFGSFRITYQNSQVEIHLTPIMQSLLAYLLLNDRYLHSREALTGLFWGDLEQEKARGCLSTALWRLRRALEPDGVSKGTYLLTSPNGEIGFNRESNYWLDVSLFKREGSAITAVSLHEVQPNQIAPLSNALKLYAGDLLEGLYEDWTLREREHLRIFYLSGLSYLMRYHRLSTNFELSLVYGQSILDLEPLREEVHRDLMRLYMLNGQRALAVQQYEACCRALAKELGIDPMQETRQLYQQIIAEQGGDEPKPDAPPQRLPTPADNPMEQAIEGLQQALSAYSSAGLKLKHAIQLIQQLSQQNDQH